MLPTGQKRRSTRAFLCPNCGDTRGRCCRLVIPADPRGYPERVGWVCTDGPGDWPPFLGDPEPWDLRGRGVAWIATDGAQLLGPEVHGIPAPSTEQPSGPSTASVRTIDAFLSTLHRLARAPPALRARVLDERGVPAGLRDGIDLVALPPDQHECRRVLRDVIRTAEEELGRDELLQVPGVRADGRGGRGLSLRVPTSKCHETRVEARYGLIWKDVDGRRVAAEIYFKQGSQPKRKWLQGTPAASLAYVDRPTDSGPVLVTEGAWKAIVAARRLSIRAFGLPGMSLGHDSLIEVLNREHAIRPIEYVILAFDAEAWTVGPHVASAMWRLARKLKTAKFAVRFAWWLTRVRERPTVGIHKWPVEPKGVDDALTSGAALSELTEDDFLDRIGMSIEFIECRDPDGEARKFTEKFRQDLEPKVHDGTCMQSWSVAHGFRTPRIDRDGQVRHRGPRIRPRIGKRGTVATVTTGDLMAAQREVHDAVRNWRRRGGRIGLRVPTGVGKTFATRRRVARTWARRQAEGTLLVLCKDHELCAEFAQALCGDLKRCNLDPGVVHHLYGRQYVREEESWREVPKWSGCRHPMGPALARAGHPIARSLCENTKGNRCPYNRTAKSTPPGTDREACWCRVDGYLAGLRRAKRARVLVATHSSIRFLPRDLRQHVQTVVIDEDLGDALTDTFVVSQDEVKDALARLLALAEEEAQKVAKRKSWVGDLVRLGKPLLEAVHAGLGGVGESTPVPLVDVLPDDMLTDGGCRSMQKALPHMRRKAGGQSYRTPDPLGAAPWERVFTDTEHVDQVRRRWWARFLLALIQDVEVGRSADRARSCL